MMTIEEIEAKVKEMAAKMGADDDMLPSFGSYGPKYDGLLIRVDSFNAYHYSNSERGVEREHVSTKDDDEILYIVAKDMASHLAFRQLNSESAQSAEPRHVERVRLQIEYLDKVCPRWADGMRPILKEYANEIPADAFSYARATRLHALKEQGYSDDAAWAKVLLESRIAD